MGSSIHEGLPILAGSSWNSKNKIKLLCDKRIL